MSYACKWTTTSILRYLAAYVTMTMAAGVVPAGVENLLMEQVITIFSLST